MVWEDFSLSLSLALILFSPTTALSPLPTFDDCCTLKSLPPPYVRCGRPKEEDPLLSFIFNKRDDLCLSLLFLLPPLCKSQMERGRKKECAPARNPFFFLACCFAQLEDKQQKNTQKQ